MPTVDSQPSPLATLARFGVAFGGSYLALNNISKIPAVLNLMKGHILHPATITFASGAIFAGTEALAQRIVVKRLNAAQTKALDEARASLVIDGGLDANLSARLDQMAGLTSELRQALKDGTFHEKMNDAPTREAVAQLLRLWDTSSGAIEEALLDHRDRLLERLPQGPVNEEIEALRDALGVGDQMNFAKLETELDKLRPLNPEGQYWTELYADLVALQNPNDEAVKLRLAHLKVALKDHVEGDLDAAFEALDGELFGVAKKLGNLWKALAGGERAELGLVRALYTLEAKIGEGPEIAQAFKACRAELFAIRHDGNKNAALDHFAQQLAHGPQVDAAVEKLRYQIYGPFQPGSLASADRKLEGARRTLLKQIAKGDPNVEVEAPLEEVMGLLIDHLAQLEKANADFEAGVEDHVGTGLRWAAEWKAALPLIWKEIPEDKQAGFIETIETYSPGAALAAGLVKDNLKPRNVRLLVRAAAKHMGDEKKPEEEVEDKPEITMEEGLVNRAADLWRHRPTWLWGNGQKEEKLDQLEEEAMVEVRSPQLRRKPPQHPPANHAGGGEDVLWNAFPQRLRDEYVGLRPICAELVQADDKQGVLNKHQAKIVPALKKLTSDEKTAIKSAYPQAGLAFRYLGV